MDRTSPTRLLNWLAVSIFLAEAAIMAVLRVVDPLSDWGEVLFDATALVLFLSPASYYFFFTPPRTRSGPSGGWKASDAIFLTDGAGRLLEVNSRACEMLGLARDELISAPLADVPSLEDSVANPPRLHRGPSGVFTGRAPEEAMGDRWSAAVHPEDLDICLRTRRDAFQGREPFETEYRLLHHSGEYRWIVDVGRSLENLPGRRGEDRRGSGKWHNHHGEHPAGGRGGIR